MNLLARFDMKVCMDMYYFLNIPAHSRGVHSSCTRIAFALTSCYQNVSDMPKFGFMISNLLVKKSSLLQKTN